MSALNLPKPVNTYAGEDELRKATQSTSSAPNGANGSNASTEPNGGQGEDIGEYVAPKPSDRFKEGLIYPPREVRNIIDKTALAISKSPTPHLLEDKIRERQKSDAKFAFMQEDDPFHQYYKYMKERVAEDAEAVRAGTAAPAPTAQQKAVEKDEAALGGYEPKPAEFMVDLPGVTAHDLDILRLTALFHARRGRSFLSSLSIREGRNYQFDFLRPTHSLYGYYNRMVESYQKIMQPPPGMIEALVKEAADPDLKWKTLEDARKRTEWERGRRKREDIEAKQREEEAAAYAAIDWQDFVVVETIEFTQNDMDLELPPPTSVERLKSMSMAEKRMASMVMEETGAGPTGGEQLLPEGGAAQEEMEIEDEEEEEAKTLRIKAEQEQARAREVQTAALQSKGIKIRKDYVPKGINRGATVQMGKCPYCNQSIPENELSEHIRIELLDPKWKEQRAQLEMRRAQAQQLVQGADVSASLRNLAAQRTDLFGDESDEAARKQREEEALRARKEREKIIWDGHTNSAQKTADTFQTQFTLDEQIKKMHSQMGLAGETPANAAGPQAGPGIVPSTAPSAAAPSMPNFAHLPPALAASLPKPGGGSAYAGATISAAPTGPTTHEYISAPAAAGPSVHPSRQAQMSGQDAGAPPPPLAGNVHARDEDPSAERPVFKRPKIEKLPYPQMYSEIDWQSLHPDPISLSVQLPSMPDKPEWKLDGSIITVPDLPVSFTFGTVRERIKRVVDADLPISRLRLDYMGKVMNNGATLASVNLDDGDLIVMAVKKK